MGGVGFPLRGRNRPDPGADGEGELKLTKVAKVAKVFGTMTISTRSAQAFCRGKQAAWGMDARS